MKFWKSKSEKKRDEFVKAVKNFCVDRPKTVCILADEKTNTVVMAYKNFITAIRTKGKTEVIKDLLFLEKEGKKREKAINQFFSELDGMLWAISEQIYKNKLKDKGVSEEIINKLGVNLASGSKEDIDKLKKKEMIINTEVKTEVK